MREKVSLTAAKAVVIDLQDREHRLEELWADRPAVLVLLRHFG